MAEPIITKTLYVNAEPVSSPKVSSPQREQEGNQINVPSEEKAPAYENIVSTSKDGDTVQVKPEANERLSEGFVFAKASDDKTDVNEAAAPDRNSEAREEKAAEEDIAGKNERLRSPTSIIIVRSIPVRKRQKIIRKTQADSQKILHLPELRSKATKLLNSTWDRRNSEQDTPQDRSRILQGTFFRDRIRQNRILPQMHLRST